MNVKIVKGKHTDENIQRCYHYILNVYRKELQRDSDLYKGINRRTSDKGIQS